MPLVALPGRGVIAIAGDDRRQFLQSLVSNDVTRAVPGEIVWAAFLTAQGHWRADFFIFAAEQRLLLDCERAAIPMLLAELARYRLRSHITLADVSDDFRVHAAWDDFVRPAAPALTAQDPRTREIGFRLLSPVPLAANADFEAWDRHRVSLGLPDGSRDLDAGRTLLLEAGFDALDGVSWSKGCYLGQEVTARTRYRGLVKQRLIPVVITGLAPPRDTPITREGVRYGTMRSHAGNLGLAMLRTEALGGGLTAGAATVLPRLPAWFIQAPKPSFAQ